MKRARDEHSLAVMVRLVAHPSVQGREAGEAWKVARRAFRHRNPFADGWDVLYRLIRDHHEREGSAPALSALALAVDGLPADAPHESEQKTLARLRVEDLRKVKRRPDMDEFRARVAAVKEDVLTESLSDLLRDSAAIAGEGLPVGRNRERLRGASVAVRHLAEGALSLLGEASDGAMPEGNARLAGAEARDAYQRRKDGQARGIGTGMPGIDDPTGGGWPGDLWLIAGSSHDGKTTLLLNWVWHAWAIEGRNVAIATAEMTREQYLDMLVCRHSAHPKFAAAGHRPLSYGALKTGRLSEEQEEFLRGVLWPDFESCPDYGECVEVFQLPSGFKVADLHAKAFEVDGQHRLDALFVDYLMLGEPSRLLGGSHKEEAQLIKELKGLALNFRGGQGLWVVTPHHVSKEGKKAELKARRYSLLDLGMTQEAARTPDKIVTISRDEELDGQATVGLIKNRAGVGGLVRPFPVLVNPACLLVREERFDASALSGEKITL